MSHAISCKIRAQISANVAILGVGQRQQRYPLAESQVFVYADVELHAVLVGFCVPWIGIGIKRKTRRQPTGFNRMWAVGALMQDGRVQIKMHPANSEISCRTIQHMCAIQL